MVDKASTPQQEYSGPEKGSYTSFGDMFDGGGPGRSGGPFQGGGLLSAVANAFTGNNGVGVGPEAGVGFAGYGYNDKQGNWVPAGVDMRNGGGAGMAGPTFQGGGTYSLLANILGIRPYGFDAYQQAAADQLAATQAATMAKPPLSEILAQRTPAAAPPAQTAADPMGAGVMPVNSRLNMPVGSLPMHMQFVPGVTPATPLPEDYGLAPPLRTRRFA